MIKHFFDHLFYRIYWWNIKVVYEKQLPLYSTIIGMSVFEMFNIFFLVDVVLLYGFDTTWSELSKYYYLIVPIGLCIVNYFIYVKTGRYRQILKEGEKLPKDVLRKKDVAVISYILITFALIIWIVIEGRAYNLAQG